MRVSGAQTMQSPSSSISSKAIRKVVEGRIGKRVEELDLIKPADEIDEGRERGHRGEGTKAVKGDRGSGMGHQMKEERGIKGEER